MSVVPSSANEPERTVWSVTVPEQAPVGPTLSYGRNPSNAISVHPAEPLAVGAQYRVWVMYTVGGDGIVASGQATFTWYPLD